VFQVMKGAAERERERLAKQVVLSFFLSVPVCLPVCACLSFFCLYICNSVCLYRREEDIISAIKRGFSARAHTHVDFFL
jgi:nitrate reductase beta subunit